MTGLMKETSLENIADGVAVELFAHEMKKLAKNIADPNTKPTSKRTITLTFEFAPDDAREEVHCHVSAKTKLVPTKGHSKTVHMGKRNGEPTLFGQDTKQMNMFDDGVSKIETKQVSHA